MKQHFWKSAFESAFKGSLASLWIAGLFLCILAHAADPSVDLKANPNKVPSELENVGVKEHLGRQLPLDQYEFISSDDGQKHKLKEYFSEGKPTVLNLVYYECPMLCTLVLNGVLDGLKGLDWSVGKEFNVVTISINPTDSVQMAKAKRETYLESYAASDHSFKMRDPAVTQKGWHFFTGEEAQIKKLANDLGFEYQYDARQKQYAHAAVTFMLTPNGYISRYLYGIQYRARDLRLALIEAAQGKVGNVFDRILMFCYHYEPNAKGYTLQVIRVMQLGALATIALLGGYLAVFWTRQRKGKIQ